MAARDSLGFPLPPLTPTEAAARERCLAAGAAESLAKTWTTYKDLIDSFAANPTAAPPKKLKALVRTGVPPALRAAHWPMLSGGTALRAAAPVGYDALVSKADALASPKSVISRAELELFNPFPLHPLLSSMKGMRAVRRIVLAHAAWSGSTEYAQGVNSVAAFLLANMGMGEEEAAFWTLCALTRFRLHRAFYEELRGCRVERCTLENLARRKVPRVPQLFDKLEAPLAEVTGEWMVSLFTRSLPAESAARVFDCLVVEGAKSLHRTGLALLKIHEAPLVSTCKGSLKLGQMLKWRVARTYDSDQLMKVAFKGLGSLPIATICALRAGHEAALAADHSALASRLSALVRAPGAASTPALVGSRPVSPSASTSSASLATVDSVEAPLVAPQLSVGKAAAGAARPPLAPRPQAPMQPRAHGSPPEMLQMASLRVLLSGVGAR